ncbi:MAG: adenylate/guanylate cyclase domain-containing protein [Nodosilinea sp.]
MKISIRALLTWPFLIQLFFAVGFVGWFSYASGQRLVEEVVENLRDETTERVQNRIQLYLSTPHIINQLNYSEYLAGNLDLEDSASLERKFWNQINSFHYINSSNKSNTELNESVNNIYFGRADGTLYGAEYQDQEKQVLVMRSNETTGNILNLFFVDGFGMATKTSKPRKKKATEPYNATARPWYEKAFLEGDGAVWSDIYGDYSTGESSVITATRTVYENGVLVGVFASDLLLKEVSVFLGNLDVSENGKVFLTDREGLVLSLIPEDVTEAEEDAENIPGDTGSIENATSDGEPNDSGPNLPAMKDTGDELIESAGQCLEDAGLFLEQIQEPRELTCMSQEPFFLQVLPINDEYGLDWLAFTAIPKSDFMSQLYASRRRNFAVLISSLAVATIFGLLTSKWIAKPILKLKESAALLSGSVNQNLPRIEVDNPSELEALAESFNRMAIQLKDSFEKQVQLNNAYSRFVPMKLVEILGKEITEIKLGDDIEQEDMSILFSDIRDFTSISESMRSPKENFDFLNSYLGRMEPAITENSGFIDKYIGDAIMAVFPNEPIPFENFSPKREVSKDLEEETDSINPYMNVSNSSADNAVRAGIAMIEALQSYNKTRKDVNRKELRIGIGINTGKMMLGTVGGPDRMDGTVISDEVNLASRLESLTKRFGISMMISSKTLETLENKDTYHYRFLGSVQVKGRAQAVDVYEIFDGDSNEVIRQKIDGKPYFEEAIALYQKADFLKSQKLFEEALERYSNDKASKFYIERCINYLEKGTPEDWDGVEQFSEK